MSTVLILWLVVKVFFLMVFNEVTLQEISKNSRENLMVHDDVADCERCLMVCRTLRLGSG